MYALSGNFYYFPTVTEDFFEAESGKLVLLHLTTLLDFYFKEKSITEEGVRSFFEFVYKDVKKISLNNFQEFDDEIQEIFKEMKFATMYRLSNLLNNTFTAIDNEKYIEKMNEYLGL